MKKQMQRCRTFFLLLFFMKKPTSGPQERLRPIPVENTLTDYEGQFGGVVGMSEEDAIKQIRQLLGQELSHEQKERVKAGLLRMLVRLGRGENLPEMFEPHGITERTRRLFIAAFVAGATTGGVVAWLDHASHDDDPWGKTEEVVKDNIKPPLKYLSTIPQAPVEETSLDQVSTEFRESWALARTMEDYCGNSIDNCSVTMDCVDGPMTVSTTPNETTIHLPEGSLRVDKDGFSVFQQTEDALIIKADVGTARELTESAEMCARYHQYFINWSSDVPEGGTISEALERDPLLSLIAYGLIDKWQKCFTIDGKSFPPEATTYRPGRLALSAEGRIIALELFKAE